MTLKTIAQKYKLTIQSFPDCEEIIEGRIGSTLHEDNGILSVYVSGLNRDSKSILAIGGIARISDGSRDGLRDWSIIGIPESSLPDLLKLAVITSRNSKSSFEKANTLYYSFGDPKPAKRTRNRKSKENDSLEGKAVENTLIS